MYGEICLPCVTHSDRYRPFLDRYEVSTEGRVRSVETGHILRPYLGPRGRYCRVSMYHEGVKIQPKVHFLLTAALYGPKPDDHDIRHLDGYSENNRWDNLVYVDREWHNNHHARDGKWKN